MAIAMSPAKTNLDPGPDPVKHHEPNTFWFYRRSFILVPLTAVLVMILTRPDPEPRFDIRLHQNGHDTYINVEIVGKSSDLALELSPLLRCSRVHRRVGDPEIELCQVYHSSGMLISTLADLPDPVYSPIDLYLVPPDRPFMWPSVRIGHITEAGHVSTADQRHVFVETLSMSPRVFRVHNMLSDDEIEQIMNEARDARKKTVSDRYRSNINERRTAEDWNAENSETVSRIRERTRAMLGMNVPDSWSEPFEMLIYGPGKCFTLHDDYIDAETLLHQPEFDIRSELLGSNRYATVIFYFNDVELGGETVFAYGDPVPGMPADNLDAVIEQIMSNDTEVELLKHAGIEPGTFEMSLLATCRSRFSVKPQRGSVVLFYNQLPEGGVDTKALHGGCPVLKGEKIAANIITWNGPTNLASEEEIEAMLSQIPYNQQEPVQSSNEEEEEPVDESEQLYELDDDTDNDHEIEQDGESDEADMSDLQNQDE